MALGERLLSLLIEKNITQKRLASELGIATSTLNGYIKNYRQPDYHTLGKIAGYLTVSVDYLLELTEYKNDQEIISQHAQFTDAELELIKAYRNMDKKGQMILLDVAKYCLVDDPDC